MYILNQSYFFWTKSLYSSCNSPIHKDAKISLSVRSILKKSDPEQKLTKNYSFKAETIVLYSDGSFDYLDESKNKQSKSANWINGNKDIRKEALEIVFKNTPDSDKLISDLLSKLGQPLASGKIGREINILNMTLVSLFEPASEKISWKVAARKVHFYSETSILFMPTRKELIEDGLEEILWRHEREHQKSRWDSELEIREFLISNKRIRELRTPKKAIQELYQPNPSKPSTITRCVIS